MYEKKELQKYLETRKIDTQKAISLINEFEKYMDDNNGISYDNVHSFAQLLIREGKNTRQNFLFLVHFGYFLNNHDLILASMELVDGSEMMQNFSNMLIEDYGMEFRNKVFENKEVPPLGYHPRDKAKFTSMVVSNFIKLVGEKEATNYFERGWRDSYSQYYENAREYFKEAGDIRQFLKSKSEKFKEELKSHLDAKTLFYTQEINERVLEYVNNAEIESGRFEKDEIHISKIPYLTMKALEAKTGEERQYYFCHNPWVRESLIDSTIKIDKSICHSCGGYYKDYWGFVMGESVDVKLTDSVMHGGKACSFKFKVPNNVLDNFLPK